MGFDATETVEEFQSQDDGEVKLTKKKITKKSVPPDISAVKLLMELNGEKGNFDDLSDEELENEKQELLKLLKESEDD